LQGNQPQSFAVSMLDTSAGNSETLYLYEPIQAKCNKHCPWSMATLELLPR